MNKTKFGKKSIIVEEKNKNYTYIKNKATIDGYSFDHKYN